MIRKSNLFNIYRLISKRHVYSSAKYYNNKAEEPKDYTHFGFETVKTDEKTEKGNCLN